MTTPVNESLVPSVSIDNLLQKRDAMVERVAVARAAKAERSRLEGVVKCPWCGGATRDLYRHQGSDVVEGHCQRRQMKSWQERVRKEMAVAGLVSAGNGTASIQRSNVDRIETSYEVRRYVQIDGHGMAGVVYPPLRKQRQAAIHGPRQMEVYVRPAGTYAPRWAVQIASDMTLAVVVRRETLNRIQAVFDAGGQRLADLEADMEVLFAISGAAGVAKHVGVLKKRGV